MSQCNRLLVVFCLVLFASLATPVWAALLTRASAPYFGIPQEVAFRDHYAFVATSDFFLAFDITDPTNWREVYRNAHRVITTKYNFKSLHLVGNTAYVHVPDAVNVYDISNPAKPVYKKKWGVNGSTVRFWQNRMYVDASDGYDVFEISIASLPRRVARLEGGADLAFVVHGNRAYLSKSGQYGDDAGLWIYDLSTSATPTLIGRGPKEKQYQGLFPVGSYIFAATTSELKLLDVSDPQNIIFHDVDFLPPFSALGITIGRVAFSDDDKSAYVLTSLGIVTLDISALANVSVVGYGPLDYPYQPYGFGYFLKYNRGHLFGPSVVVIDVASPEAPRIVARIPESIAAEGVVVNDNWAFVRDWDLGLIVYDVSNPPTPLLKATLPLPGPFFAMEIHGDYIYFTNGGLRVIDVSDPLHPQLLDQPQLYGSATRMNLAGDMIYLTDGVVRLVDISNPREPREVGSMPLPTSAFDLVIMPERNLLGVIGRSQPQPDALYVIDVADGNRPSILSTVTFEVTGVFPYWNVTIPDAIGATSADIGGQVPELLLSCREDAFSPWGASVSYNVRAYRLTDPRQPMPVRGSGGYATRYRTLAHSWTAILGSSGLDLTCNGRSYSYSIEAHDAAVTKGWVYVAAGGNGLVVLKNSDPSGPGTGSPTPTPTPRPTATQTPTPTGTPTPTPTPRAEDVMVFVLDDYGGVHIGGAANSISLTGGPYFGWNIARALQLVFGLPTDRGVGALVLDGYGALHTLSCRRPMQNLYFDSDVATDFAVFQKDLSGVPGNIGAFVLDRTGKLWACGEADMQVAAQGSLTPALDGVTNYAVDVELADQTGASGWIMDNHGNVQAFGGATAPNFPVSAQNNWVRLVAVGDQLVRMDAAGNLSWSGTPNEAWTLPMLDGDMLIDLEVEPGRGFIALDRFGAIYATGIAVRPPAGQGPPYFGFEAARDLDLGAPFAP